MEEYKIVIKEEKLGDVHQMVYLLRTLRILGYRTHIEESGGMFGAGTLNVDKPLDDTARKIVEAFDFRFE